MSNYSSTNIHSSEYQSVIIQMASDSYLSSSPTESGLEISDRLIMDVYDVFKDSRKMIIPENGGFHLEQYSAADQIAVSIGQLQSQNQQHWYSSRKTETALIWQTPMPSFSIQWFFSAFKEVDVSYADELSGRLQYLYEIREEELPDEQPLSSASLFSFYEFLKQNSDLAYPQVTLTYEGNIKAVWRKSKNQFLSIEFTGDSEVRYVVFGTNQKHPGKVDRAAAQTTRDRIFDFLLPYNVASWIQLASN